MTSKASMDNNNVVNLWEEKDKAAFKGVDLQTARAARIALASIGVGLSGIVDAKTALAEANHVEAVRELEQELFDMVAPLLEVIERATEVVEHAGNTVAMPRALGAAGQAAWAAMALSNLARITAYETAGQLARVMEALPDDADLPELEQAMYEAFGAAGRASSYLEKLEERVLSEEAGK